MEDLYYMIYIYVLLLLHCAVAAGTICLLNYLIVSFFEVKKNVESRLRCCDAEH